MQIINHKCYKRYTFPELGDIKYKFFSEKEAKVVFMFMKGFKANEVGDKLGFKTCTAYAYLNKAMEKFDMNRKNVFFNIIGKTDFLNSIDFDIQNITNGLFEE